MNGIERAPGATGTEWADEAAATWPIFRLLPAASGGDPEWCIVQDDGLLEMSLGVGKGTKRGLRAVVEGVIVGVVMATLSLLIPSAVFGLPELSPFVRSEAGLFGVATLAGLLGTPLLRSFATKVFGVSAAAAN